jgi:hypothetical protein
MDAQHMPTPRRVSFWPIPTRVGPIGGYNGDFYSALTYAPPPEPALGLRQCTGSSKPFRWKFSTKAACTSAGARTSRAAAVIYRVRAAAPNPDHGQCLHLGF